MSSLRPVPSAGLSAHSELALRVASAVVLVALALGGAYVGGPAFAALWAAAGAAIAFEWTAIVRLEPRRALRIIVPAGVFMAGLATFFGGGGSCALILAATSLAILVLAQGARSRLWLIAGLFYAAVLAVVPIVVRNLPELGLGGILWMFAVVWATDVAGYFAGRYFGGPRLWPRVSPKKTWSGFVGGTLAGVLGGYLVTAAVWGIDDSAKVLVAGAVASVAGQGGDLAESAFKRHFGVKDSSHLIPGHGGFMDRLDGFWAVSLIIGLGLLARAAFAHE